MLRYGHVSYPRTGWGWVFGEARRMQVNARTWLYYRFDPVGRWVGLEDSGNGVNTEREWLDIMWSWHLKDEMNVLINELVNVIDDMVRANPYLWGKAYPEE